MFSVHNIAADCFILLCYDFRNTDEWCTGIHDKDGRFGHFQVSHVSRDLVTLDTVRSNVKNK